MSSVFEGKSISSTIMKLGVPAMLGQLATLVYNLADTYFVSLTKSAEQIAAVTLCVPILLIVMSILYVFRRPCRRSYSFLRHVCIGFPLPRHWSR